MKRYRLYTSTQRYQTGDDDFVGDYDTFKEAAAAALKSSDPFKSIYEYGKCVWET